MDRITASLLAEYCRENHIAHLAEDKQFEHFATYVVVSRFQSDGFDPADLITGSGGDIALDTVGMVVNGTLVTDVEEVIGLADTNRILDVTFVFVQADRGTGFQSNKLGEIAFGVCDFFKENPTLPQNAAIQDARAIMAAIYERSNLFSRGNPECRVFYVTTGRWQTDPHLDARRRSAVEQIKDTNLFREVEVTPIGADELQRLYHQTKNAISRTFTFVNKTVVPEASGVTEAYLGLLPAGEFMNLITDEDGRLVKSIFYENVRDWLDFNEVNAGIRDTLGDATMRSRFALMNNGVTIIAKTLRPTGNRFVIEDYQIVNGCQTSHVLYEQQSQLDPSVLIPVRVIATDDDDVVASIIKATNKQTQVREEQFFALSSFGKKLELYFHSFENGKKLFYERRTRQYNATPGVEKVRVITQDALIRAYISVFRDEPHRTTRSFGDVKATVGKTIFNDTDRLEPYYVSALALYRLEYMFRSGAIDTKYKPARYHILMAFRLLANPRAIPRANSHEMERFCTPLRDRLWDLPTAITDLTNAARVVDEVAGGNLSRDEIRTLQFTTALKDKCMELAGAAEPTQPQT